MASIIKRETTPSTRGATVQARTPVEHPDTAPIAKILVEGPWTLLEDHPDRAHAQKCRTCLNRLKLQVEAAGLVAASTLPVANDTGVYEQSLALRPAEHPAAELSRKDPEKLFWAEVAWAGEDRRPWQWVAFAAGSPVAVVSWDRGSNKPGKFRPRGYLAYAMATRVGIFDKRAEAQEESMFLLMDKTTALVDLFQSIKLWLERQVKLSNGDLEKQKSNLLEFNRKNSARARTA